MIIQPARFTTNVDPRLLEFVDSVAKNRSVTRRKVIEEAILKLEHESKKQPIVDAYNRMADDQEEMDQWLSIANNPANLNW